MNAAPTAGRVRPTTSRSAPGSSGKRESVQVSLAGAPSSTRPTARGGGAQQTAATLARLRFAVDGMRPLPPKAAALSTLAARVQSFRRSDDLSLSERRELDVIAFGYLRRRQLARESAARRRDLPQLFRQVTLLRERSLVASIGSNGEAVQPWRALVGFEGRPTGDGRFIDPGAIEAASLPMPLRWTPTDLGGHQGAVIVGRIDRLVRLANGAIIAFGVIDLGSDDGREVVRLIRGRFLSGVSMDLDSTASELATLSTDPVTGKKTQASVVSTGRLRAATLLAIPAFDEARIVLDDCGCDNELTIINERKA